MRIEPSGDSGKLVAALEEIAAVSYPYCRACRSRTSNRVGGYTFNKAIRAHQDDCTCASCNEPCEDECPRGIARRALEEARR